MKNEEIKSFELGYGYVSDKLTLNINVYSTNWGNRFITRSNPFTQGTDGTAQLKDIDVTHKGLEIGEPINLVMPLLLKEWHL